MRYVENFEAREVADDAVPDVVQHICADIKVSKVFGADEQLFGEDRHLVVREVDPLQLVGDPLALREHLARDEGHFVVTEIDLADGEAVLEQAVRLVLQILDLVVRQVEVAQCNKTCERGDRNLWLIFNEN